MSNLQDILPKLRKPKRFPTALPLIHVSKSGKSGFEQIINQLSLSPSNCKVFNQYLLYFSYGSVFYDTGNQPTRDITKLPICFLFRPIILPKMSYYYPYDTGAAKFNKYGKHSEHLSNNFNRYKVNNNSNIQIEASRQLVYYIYGTNKNYIIGKIKTKVQKKLCNSLLELFEFFEDKNVEECDERQYTIECQTKQDITLRNNLEWIAFPDRYYDLVGQLFNTMQPLPPYRYAYDTGTVNHPLKIMGEIRAAAHKYINNKYLL